MVSASSIDTTTSARARLTSFWSGPLQEPSMRATLEGNQGLPNFLHTAMCLATFTPKHTVCVCSTLKTCLFYIPASGLPEINTCRVQRERDCR
ncbi:hypothetical protein Zmor_026182 [Zophobas morio]|uniref:Uncharacterized protein n=1 Tax=Zophobas morio TaxID=2755281 RepID=A0AA38HUX6_9CUCU|nr:hypothetical protein Zmor_026182 [Zophobas morio]